MLALSGGVRVPQLGFSVAGFRRPDAAKVVRAAIETGYRAIDTDRANEAEVADAIAASGVARDELFVTTKVSAETVLKGFEGHSDMCLLSGPGKESAAALTRLHADGRFRAIGVAGFGVAELRRLIETTGTVPAVNQVELHPWRQQVPLREFHDGQGIVTGAADPVPRLTDETVTSHAAKYGKTPAQIVLRWHLQLGTLPVVKSVVTARIHENFGVFDFELAEDDLAVLAELDTV